MSNKNFIVTDYEADESIRKLKTGTVVPAQEFFAQPAVSRPDSAAADDKPVDDQLSPVELRFITAVVDYPMHSASEYIKLAHISPNKLCMIRSKMAQEGFIREHILESGGRGRAQIKLEPLEPAKMVVANLRKG